MADFTDADLPQGAGGFSDKDITTTKPPSIFERIGQGYRKFTAPSREGIARFIESGGGPFSKYSPLWTMFLPGERKVPPQEPPSAPARFAAGMIVPESPTQAALMATLPFVSKLGTPVSKFIEGAAPMGDVLKGIAARTAAATGIGAGTSALTGEKPAVGGIEGAASNVAGELLGLGKAFVGRDVIPATPKGYSRAQERFAPKVDLTTPQPGNWVRSIVDDLPVLRNHIRTYDDLLGLKSMTSGNRVVRNSKLADTVGKEIYRPFHTILDLLAPNLRFNFPYLMPGRFGRLSIPDPTISEILPNVDERILRRAGNLSPNEALTIIQQLKDAAFNPSNTGAIRGAAKKFATQVEEDFLSTLDRVNPQLRGLYADARKQYSQLKGLQLVVSKNAGALFPGGSSSKAGLDPVGWAKVLRENEHLLPEAAWPRLHNSVTFGGLELGGGATLRAAPHGDVRTYMEMMPGTRSGFALLRPSPKMEIPTTPPKPLSPIFRAVPPAAMSGLEALKEEK